MNDRNSPLKQFQQAVYDHEKEGIELLFNQPSRWILALNGLLLALLVAVLIWSFFARADVIVTAPGTLEPDADIRHVFPPVDGELRDIYVQPGALVSEGDLIARMNARGAVEAATKAQEARLQLAEIQREAALFPQKRAIRQRQAEAQQERLAALEAELVRRQDAGLARVAEAQRARLLEARTSLQQAQRAEQAAREELERFERLIASPGGGGISGNQVRQKREEWLQERAGRRTAEARLAALEYEVNEAISRADEALLSLQQEVADLRVAVITARQEIEDEAAQLEFRLRSAELAANAAERLSFANFDEENNLRIFAPVSGVVAEVGNRQSGARLQPGVPMVSIAPAGAVPVLKVDIAEKDRGFLQTGQQARLKFNAFPYRLYGSLSGRLEYISPTATGQESGRAATYEGRISLDRSHFTTSQGDFALTYGMAGVAELVVRERRFIDLALDPLRGLAQ